MRDRQTYGEEESGRQKQTETETQIERDIGTEADIQSRKVTKEALALLARQTNTQSEYQSPTCSAVATQDVC